MLTVLFRGVDIDSDSLLFCLNLQCLIPMGVDHSLGPLIQRGAEQLGKQLARKDNRMAPLTLVAWNNNQLF